MWKRLLEWSRRLRDFFLIKNTFIRNAYSKIKSHIYFQDKFNTNETKQDKSFKMKFILKKINENFKQWGFFNKCFIFDEVIVRYYILNFLFWGSEWATQNMWFNTFNLFSLKFIEVMLTSQQPHTHCRMKINALS